VATQSSSQWTLKQWADYVKTGTDPNGNSSKVYNIISLEVTGTELAKKVRAPRLVREIDWVDNFWNFPGGKGNVVDEKKQNGANGINGNHETNGHITEITGNDTNRNGVAPQTDGPTETKPKGKAPSIWPKVQLYCLVSIPPLRH
jgi:F-box/leucine-rich repeat protein 10/11